MGIHTNAYVFTALGAAVAWLRRRTIGYRELFVATGTDNGFEMPVVAGSQAQYALRRHYGSTDRNENGKDIAENFSRNPLHRKRLYLHP